MAFAANPNPGVFPIQSSPYGQTYGQWSAKWWQYAFSVSAPSGQDAFAGCPMEPSSQIWFLAGTAGGTATRSCTVPAGRAILFPIFHSEQSNVAAEAALAQTSGQSSCTTVINNQTVLISDINGNPITGTDFPALQSCAQALADHAKKPGGALAAEVDGKSLTNLPGKHTIHLAATVPFTDVSPPVTFTTEATYCLIVQPSKQTCP